MLTVSMLSCPVSSHASMYVGEHQNTGGESDAAGARPHRGMSEMAHVMQGE